MEANASVSPGSSGENSSSDGERGTSVSPPIYNEVEGYDDPAGMLPGTEDYPGPMNFQLFLNTEEKAKRSWLYSTVLKKLYVDINKVVCVQFKMKRPDDGGINSSKEVFSVRALPVYASPEYLREPVMRCPVHVMSDKNAGHSDAAWLYHVLRAEHHEAVYQINGKSNRHSVLVPLREPALGAEYVTIMYKFTCKTSCAFGLNRRPVHVIFTLENAQGKTIGRRKLLVKVCSCPKRDLHRDETVSNAEVEPVGRKRRIKEVDNSLSFTSMEIYSPPTKEIKMERLDPVDEPLPEETFKYRLPLITVNKKQFYKSTLEILHSHFMGLAVRHDALIDLHPIISTLADLMRRAVRDDYDDFPVECSTAGGDSTAAHSPVGSSPLTLEVASNSGVNVTYQVAEASSNGVSNPEEVTEEYRIV